MEREKFINIMKNKVFFSDFTGKELAFVEELPDSPNPNQGYFDGMYLLDSNGDEDDIQHVWSVLKSGEPVNLEEYYQDNNGYDDAHDETFINAINNLMDKDEYYQMEHEDWGYPRITIQVDDPIIDTIVVEYGQKAFDPFIITVKKKDGTTETVSVSHLTADVDFDHDPIIFLNSDVTTMIAELKENMGWEQSSND
ncbi:MAG: hypothetical protein LIP03_14640 [Bacteroidales bacterium]|nr:hypothetical protein [Bacteroidales bacterium]